MEGYDMTTTTTKKAQRIAEMEDARESLLTHYVTTGATVYTILRSRSSSGMFRTISLVVALDGKMQDITYYAAQALGERLIETNGRRAIRQNGCGMDMGFNLVYNLSSVLFKGEERAGYILRQEWI
jgi:hypothetical protein